jgi:nitroreductase
MFFSLIKNRRSIRKYRKQEIEKDKIEKLMQAVLLSPSSKAKFPCEFIFVNDKELLAKLSQSKPHGSAFLANAPLGIVVTADSTKSDVWIEDASITATFIILAAEALDLGACWIQIRKRKYSDTIDSEAYTRNILSIPDNRRVLSIVGVGYPDETKMPRQEGGLEYDKVFFNQYGKY